jgi:hypothetical protein
MAGSSPATDRQQYVVFSVISAGAVASAALAEHLGVTFFGRFLGSWSPTLAVSCSALLGAALVAVLVAHGWFVVGPGDHRGPLLAVGAAAGFGAIVIAADVLVPFPRDLNAPFPDSLLFYPAIAFLVEVVFHLLPLTALLALAHRVVGPERRGYALTICVVAVALLEPTFQAVMGAGSDPATWVPIAVWVHVTAINLSQLVLFRRYGFVSMLTLRLAYYLAWHVVWGHYRLRLLF